MRWNSVAFSMNKMLANREQSTWVNTIEVLAPAIPLALCGWLATYILPISRGNVAHAKWAWIPSLSVELSFWIDGLSLLFALLITGIGVLVAIYVAGYFSPTRRRSKLFGWLFLFMLAMLGLVLADNIILMFVFWELTSFTSYLLIGYRHEDSSSRDAALQALLVTGFGGLSLLAGLVLLAGAGGSYELSTLIRAHPIWIEDPRVSPAIVLILLGAFTKSAQFPFHFWLPAAMAAPTPVSAYLHSATMVKAGVYLVARLSPAMSGHWIWDNSIFIVGGLTGIVGGVMSLYHTDLKKILAYSTVSALGMLMLLLSIGTELAAKAAIVLLLAHSLYKGGLFLVAGAIDHATGTRDIRRLGGLLRTMPWLAIAAASAGISMAGLPPAAGFIAKEVAYEASLGMGRWAAASLPALLAIGVCSVAAAGLVSLRPLLVGTRRLPAWLRLPRRADRPFANRRNSHLPARQLAEIDHPSHWRLVAPPLILGLLGMAIGFFPGRIGTLLIAPAVAALGHEAAISLKLWPGIGGPLAWSALTIVLGTIGYLSVPYLRATRWRLRHVERWDPAAGYTTILRTLKLVASWQTGILQNGRLRTYLLVVLVTFGTYVGLTVVKQLPRIVGSFTPSLALHELFIPILMVAATWMVCKSSSRLAAVCGLGVIGYAVAMLFVMYGAPDLAMTQFAIETLTVILFVLVVHRLPKFATLSSWATRRRDATIAAFVGSIMAAITLAATYAHVPSRLTSYFADNSLAVAKGRNMVDVILVDFRALDTLGEVGVLAVAALGIFGLLRLRIPPTTSGNSSTSPDPIASLPLDVSRLETNHPPKRSLILTTATVYLLPLLLLFSVFLLLRGHNDPGGGFVGGLAAAAAFSLYAIAFGVKQARLLVLLHPRTIIANGLLLALASGLLAVASGLPYMTGLWTTWQLPAVGKLGTPLLFDVGIYLVVIGMVIMIVFELAED